MNDEHPIEERLPYPTRPMYFPDGTSVEEFIIPEGDKEIVLEQLYPFSPIPKLTDEVEDLHSGKKILHQRLPRDMGTRHELSCQPILSRKWRHGD